MTQDGFLPIFQKHDTDAASEGLQKATSLCFAPLNAISSPGNERPCSDLRSSPALLRIALIQPALNAAFS